MPAVGIDGGAGQADLRLWTEHTTGVRPDDQVQRTTGGGNGAAIESNPTLSATRRSRRLQRQGRVATGGLMQGDATVPGDGAVRDQVFDAGAGVEGVAIAICDRLGNDRVRWVQQPQSACAVIGTGIHKAAFGVQGVGRGFHLATITAMGTPSRQNGAGKGGFGAGLGGIGPQHHRTAFAVIRGAGINGGALLHCHRGGLIQRIGVIKHPTRFIRPALPVAAHQHLAAAGGAGGGDRAVCLQADVVAGEQRLAAEAAAPAHVDVAAAENGEIARGRRGFGLFWGGRLNGRAAGGMQAHNAASGAGRIQHAANAELAGEHVDGAAEADIFCGDRLGGRGVVRFSHSLRRRFGEGQGLGGSGAEHAVELGVVARFDDDLAGAGGGVGLDAAAGGLFYLRDLDAHAAAVVSAGAARAKGAGVDERGRGDFDVASGAAFGFAVANGGIGAERAAVLDPVAGRQDEAAALLLQAVGLNLAAVAHHPADQAIERLCGNDDQAAGGLDGVAVVHQGLQLGGFDADAGKAVVAVKVQVHGLAGGQGDRAQVGDDGPLVAHLGREQRNVTAERGLEFALVHHTAGAALALEAALARHEVVVADAVGGGHQPAHVYPRRLAEVHPMRVGEDDMAIGADTPKDLARVVAHHPVKHHGAGAGLLKLHMRVGPHVETLPVDRGAVAALVDHHVAAALADAGLTGAHLAAAGQRIRRGCALSQHALGKRSTHDRRNRS